MIEVTDRYGGNPPSSLRGCRGNCEAMGVYPRFAPVPGAHPRDIDAQGTWEFVTCEQCHGTGKAPWTETITRIPGWIVKGLRFMFVEAPRCQPDEPRHRSCLLGFKCAFLADLGLWRP